MKKSRFLIIFFVLMVFTLQFGYSASDAFATVIYLSDLNWTSATNGWGPVEKDMSNGEQAAGDGHEITIDGVKYAKGIGCHANSEITYNLAGQYTFFTSYIAIDDEVLSEGGGGSVEFQVWGDGKKLYDSGTSPYITSGQIPQGFGVSVVGVNTLQLIVLAGSTKDNDHADWADAYLVTVPQRPLSGASGIIDGQGNVIYKVGNWHLTPLTGPPPIPGAYQITPDCPSETYGQAQGGLLQCYINTIPPAACTCTSTWVPGITSAATPPICSIISEYMSTAGPDDYPGYQLVTLTPYTVGVGFQFTCGQ